MTHDSSVLEAALVGYQVELTRINQAMAEIRKRIGGATSAPGQVSSPRKRELSASARKRIAAAQKKRWAEYHKQKEEKRG
jgi:hypothetical protein